MTLFKILIYILTASSLWCMDQALLYENFSNQNYAAIVADFENNPDAYSTVSRLNILGQSQMALGQTKAAVRSCVKVIVSEASKPCSQILRKIRIENSDLYDHEMASYYLTTADFTAALSKFYKLHSKYPDQDEYRVGLIRVFLGQSQFDSAQELVWSLAKDNPERPNFSNLLKFNLGNLIQSSKGSSEDTVLRYPDSFYQILLISQEKKEPYFGVLLQHLDQLYKDPKSNLTEIETMRLANLYFLKGAPEAAWEMIDEYKDYLIEPRAVISMKSLISRLPKRSSQVDEQETKVLAASQSANSQQLNKASGVTVKAQFVPLELSELDLATVDNLEAFHKLSEDYADRMKLMKTPAQRRWLFSHVHAKLVEMWSHHVDPAKHAIAAYFETRAGKEFLREIETKYAEYERIDQKNSKIFSGRLTKIDSELNSAQSRKAKIQVLRQFKLEWDMYKFSADVSMKGAWSAYLKSSEGVSLLKRVDREISDLELMKGKSFSTSVYRQYR